MLLSNVENSIASIANTIIKTEEECTEAKYTLEAVDELLAVNTASEMGAEVRNMMVIFRDRVWEMIRSYELLQGVAERSELLATISKAS